MYVDSLIGPDTVTPLPEATIAVFEDQGRLARTIDVNVARPRTRCDDSAVGVDMDDVGLALEPERGAVSVPNPSEKSSPRSTPSPAAHPTLNQTTLIRNEMGPGLRVHPRRGSIRRSFEFGVGHDNSR